MCPYSKENAIMSTSLLDVGGRLRRLRTEAGQTQQEFAETLGISLRAYKNYEKGLRELPASVTLQLCKISAVSPSWILLGKTDRPLPSTIEAIRASLGAGIELLRTSANDRPLETWTNYLTVLVKLTLDHDHSISFEDAKEILNIGDTK
ncbi:helix-turn-helix domain-containing protein [Celeribacter sp. SCSIO 80788]|uniref:helix-turn-helix domain-containing protein n=1 Tax=Celeribacter sp. SCSIO 80788 TaxID=3117013 RepID=UPI003DA5C45E